MTWKIISPINDQSISLETVTVITQNPCKWGNPKLKKSCCPHFFCYSTLGKKNSKILRLLYYCSCVNSFIFSNFLLESILLTTVYIFFIHFKRIEQRMKKNLMVTITKQMPHFTIWTLIRYRHWLQQPIIWTCLTISTSQDDFQQLLNWGKRIDKMEK